MRVFVTGASSDIGIRVIKRLVADGHEVTGLSRQAGLKIEKAKIVRGDIQDPKTFDAYLNDTDLIIHAAAITHTDHAETYIKINFEGTRKLVSLAEMHGAKRFLFISTRAIGLEGGGYAASKFWAEESVKNSGLNWVILRLSEVYGTNKDEGIDALIRLVLRSRIVPIIGNGRYEFSPVSIDDVAEVIFRLTQHDEILNRCYTVCGPDTLSMNDLVFTLCRFYSLRCIRLHIPVVVFKMAVHLKRVLPFPLHISRDQIARLQMPKDSDFSAATRDLGFRPRRFHEWLEQRQSVQHEGPGWKSGASDKRGAS